MRGPEHTEGHHWQTRITESRWLQRLFHRYNSVMLAVQGNTACTLPQWKDGHCFHSQTDPGVHPYSSKCWVSETLEHKLNFISEMWLLVTRGAFKAVDVPCRRSKAWVCCVCSGLAWALCLRQEGSGRAAAATSCLSDSLQCDHLTFKYNYLYKELFRSYGLAWVTGYTVLLPPHKHLLHLPGEKKHSPIPSHSEF